MKSKALSLEWKLAWIPGVHQIINVILYFNVKVPTEEVLICNWFPHFWLFPIVTTTTRNLFSNSILVSYKSDTYNFTVTNLQYNDTGPYLLQVPVLKLGSRDIAIESSTITISKIKGEHYFF